MRPNERVCPLKITRVNESDARSGDSRGERFTFAPPTAWAAGWMKKPVNFRARVSGRIEFTGAPPASAGAFFHGSAVGLRGLRSLHCIPGARAAGRVRRWGISGGVAWTWTSCRSNTTPTKCPGDAPDASRKRYGGCMTLDRRSPEVHFRGNARAYRICPQYGVSISRFGNKRSWRKRPWDSEDFIMDALPWVCAKVDQPHHLRTGLPLPAGPGRAMVCRPQEARENSGVREVRRRKPRAFAVGQALEQS